MKTLSFIFCMTLLNVFGGHLANTRIIKGKVCDQISKQPLQGVMILVHGTELKTLTDHEGKFILTIPIETKEINISFPGYGSQVVRLTKSTFINLELVKSENSLREVVVVPSPNRPASTMIRGYASSKMSKQFLSQNFYQSNAPAAYLDNESYTHHEENKFLEVQQNPLSTFSVDVDAASYSNIRRFINMGQIPPKDAVRTEELINYFSYNYPEPGKGEPVGFHVEMAAAPWNTSHMLLKIGMKAQTIAKEKLPPSNLVFLIDVSGSMDSPERLPLIQSALKMLTDQLRPIDHVSIVAYAGNAGLVLPSTPGSEKQTIKEAIDRLEAGGSTAGGQGIQLAYQIAKEHFIKGGNNRVILSTDGDFNVGVNSEAALLNLIEEKRKTGVFLSVLGVGMGNYKDSKMQVLADKGNGNHAYLDNLSEARKVLVHEFGGTLFNVAKDVKIQVEFNMAHVKGYRLIGYEKRMLNKEDFNEDKKDAGDVGAGQTVTALYEIIPAGLESEFLKSVEPLKYQHPASWTSSSSEWATIKYRYKLPHSEKSVMRQLAVLPNAAEIGISKDFKFAASVAEFGMLLRNSEFKQHSSYDQLLALAHEGKGADIEGYRTEYIQLIQSLRLLKETASVND